MMLSPICMRVLWPSGRLRLFVCWSALSPRSVTRATCVCGDMRMRMRMRMQASWAINLLDYPGAESSLDGPVDPALEVLSSTPPQCPSVASQRS